MRAGAVAVRRRPLRRPLARARARSACRRPLAFRAPGTGGLATPDTRT